MHLNPNGFLGTRLWTVSYWTATDEGQDIHPDLWGDFTAENVLPKLCPWMCHREELCGVPKETSTPHALNGISSDASSWRMGPCGGRSPELRFCYSSAIILGKGQRCENQNKSQTSLSVADSNDIYCAEPGCSSEIWGREILSRMFWCWIFIEKDIFTLTR